MAAEKLTKAWKVDGYEQSVIVYADTREKARLRGAGRLDGEYMEVAAKRAPEFDGLGPTGPSDADLFLKHGWWFECNCGAMADAASHGVIRENEFVCGDCALLQHEGREHG